MTTVAKLIEYLQTLPQEAIVEVVEMHSAYSTYMDYSPVDLDECIVYDRTGQTFVELRGE